MRLFSAGHLSGLTQLTSLSINGLTVSNTTQEAILTLTSLRSLNLTGSRLESTGPSFWLDVSTKFHELMQVELPLSTPSLIAAAVSLLRMLPKLQQLRLASLRTYDYLFEKLVGCDVISTVTIDFNGPTGLGSVLTWLRESASKVEKLRLCGRHRMSYIAPALDEDQTRELMTCLGSSPLSSLRSLDIFDLPLPSLSELSPLTSITSLALGWCEIHNTTMHQLTALRGLHELVFYDLCTSLGGDYVEASSFGCLSAAMPHLSLLRFDGYIPVDMIDGLIAAAKEGFAARVIASKSSHTRLALQPQADELA